EGLPINVVRPAVLIVREGQATENSGWGIRIRILRVRILLVIITFELDPVGNDLITERILDREVEAGIDAIEALDERDLNVIAQAQVQGQIASELPIVLQIAAEVVIGAIEGIVVVNPTTIGKP